MKLGYSSWLNFNRENSTQTMLTLGFKWDPSSPKNPQASTASPLLCSFTVRLTTSKKSLILLPSWVSLVVSPTLWRLFPLPLFSVFSLKLFFSLPPCAMWPPNFLAAVVLNHTHDPSQRNPFLPFLLHDPWWPPSLWTHGGDFPYIYYKNLFPNCSCVSFHILLKYPLQSQSQSVYLYLSNISPDLFF